jgi:hypothetical protein
METVESAELRIWHLGVFWENRQNRVMTDSAGPHAPDDLDEDRHTVKFPRDGLVCFKGLREVHLDAKSVADANQPYTPELGKGREFFEQLRFHCTGTLDRYAIHTPLV